MQLFGSLMQDEMRGTSLFIARNERGVDFRLLI